MSGFHMIFRIPLRKRLSGGTVPPSKMHPGGTVHPFKMHPSGTVPPFKMHPEGLSEWVTAQLSLSFFVLFYAVADMFNSSNSMTS